MLQAWLCLRVEFPGALYHITARGDLREDIFEDDHDRSLIRETPGDVTRLRGFEDLTGQKRLPGVS